ncbi:MAG: hypothetical protein ABSG69_05545 [Candidatus Acidiferrum sp.]|jgi:glycerol uptake facilitator-like aquaporin
MTSAENKTPSISDTLGTALLLFGAVLCYLRIEAIDQKIADLFNAYGSNAFGLLPSTGLAAARLLQNLTLNPASSLSALIQFLLSCWPVAILFVGAFFLRKTLFPSRPLSAEQASRSSAQPVRE